MNSIAPLAPLPDAVTLDQLRVFLLVAEQGSFSRLPPRRLRLGGMPLHLVAEDLEAGRLVWIAPVEWSSEPREVPLYAIHRADDLPGPAGRWLLDRLEHAAVRADGEFDRLKNKCSSRKVSHRKA